MVSPSNELTRASALLSRAIYAPDSSNFNIIRSRDGLVFGVHAPEGSGYCFLVFRGSDDPLDWQRNYDTTSRLDTHRGFRDGVLRLMPLIRNALLDFGRGRRLVITGHSLGGALAEVLGGILAERGTPPRLVVTFGAPRTRTAPWPAWFAHDRYVAEGDPIPYVPLCLTGFRHTTMPRVLTRGGIKARMGFLGRVKTFLPFGRLGRSAHSIQNYLSLLEIA